MVVGIKPPKLPLPPFFLPFLTTGVVLCHLEVACPPFYGGGVILPKGWFYTPFRVTSSPHWARGLSPFGVGGCVAHLYANQESQYQKTGCLMSVVLYVEHP